MSDHQPVDGPERDADRLLTFVDAAVAIAITLLVLPLVDLVGQVEDGVSVADVLGSSRDEIGAFLLSFAVIARLWLAQHAVVRSLVSVDAAVFTGLMAWTLTIVFLPFPTALVAAAGDDAATRVLYVGTMALSMLVLAGVAAVLRSTPALVGGGAVPSPAGALRNTALLVVALAVALVVPVVGYWSLLLLALDEPLARIGRRLRG